MTTNGIINTDKTLCKKCSCAFVGGQQKIVCQGFCSDSFHAGCVGLSYEAHIVCSGNSHIWWMCETCCDLMHELRSRDSLLAEREAFGSDRTVDESSNSSTAVIAKEIAELKRQIESINDTLAEIATSRGNVSAIGSNSEDQPQPLAHSSPATSRNLSIGSRSVRPQLHRTNNSPDETLWLFFTRVKNTVSEANITDMVAESLDVDGPIVVKKLVPTWKDVSTLPFISFKVGISAKHKDLALRSTTWPSGLSFRLFRNECDVWEP